MDKKLVIICLFGWILLPILVSCKSSNIKFVSRNPKVTESSGIVNGERIYFTGTSHIRSYIRYSGGPDFGGMMMGSLLTCASCHGPMGLGGEHNMPMQVMHAPNITYQGLQEEMEEHQDGEAKKEKHITNIPSKNSGWLWSKGSIQMANHSATRCHASRWRRMTCRIYLISLNRCRNKTGLKITRIFP